MPKYEKWTRLDDVEAKNDDIEYAWKHDTTDSRVTVEEGGERYNYTTVLYKNGSGTGKPLFSDDVLKRAERFARAYVKYHPEPEKTGWGPDEYDSRGTYLEVHIPVFWGEEMPKIGEVEDQYRTLTVGILTEDVDVPEVHDDNDRLEQRMRDRERWAAENLWSFLRDRKISYAYDDELISSVCDLLAYKDDIDVTAAVR